MANVVWRKRALTDLDEIISYIETDDPVAADRIKMRLYALGESLADFPHRGRPAVGGEREMVTVPPYILTYRVEGQAVSIVGIRHGRQQRR